MNTAYRFTFGNNGAVLCIFPSIDYCSKILGCHIAFADQLNRSSNIRYCRFLIWLLGWLVWFGAVLLRLLFLCLRIFVRLHSITLKIRLNALQLSGLSLVGFPRKGFRTQPPSKLCKTQKLQ